MEAANTARPSIFVRPEASTSSNNQLGRFTLQPNIRFHMYISQAPCRPIPLSCCSTRLLISISSFTRWRCFYFPLHRGCIHVRATWLAWLCVFPLTSRRRYADRALKRCKFSTGSDTTSGPASPAALDLNRTGAKPVDLNAGDPVASCL
jgi:hypothetical protein